MASSSASEKEAQTELLQHSELEQVAEPQLQQPQSQQQLQNQQQQNQQQQNNHMLHHRRPPKPVPVPFGVGGVLTESPPPLRVGELQQQWQQQQQARPNQQQQQFMSNDSENARLSIASQTSRQSLRQDLQRLRSSLTIQEHNFLAQLCMCGNDTDVQTAHENLLNSDLFFPPPPVVNIEVAYPCGPSTSTVLSTSMPHHHHHHHPIRFGGASERSSEAQISLMMEDLTENSEFDIGLNYYSSNIIINNSIATSIGEEGGGGGGGGNKSCGQSVGSERRQKALEERKNNFLFGKMWKAHQNGLAMSVEASKRSLIMRNSSLSMHSTTSSTGVMSRRELYQRADEIFRARQSSLSSNGGALSAAAAAAAAAAGGRSFSGNGGGGGRNLSTGTNNSSSMISPRHHLSRNKVMIPQLPPFLQQHPPLQQQLQTPLESRSDNNRRVSFPSRAALNKSPRAASLSLSTVPAPNVTDLSAVATTPTIPPGRPFPKPVLRRMQSEGSARKVTFGDLPPKNPPQPQLKLQYDQTQGEQQPLSSWDANDDEDVLHAAEMAAAEAAAKRLLFTRRRDDDELLGNRDEEGISGRPTTWMTDNNASRIMMQHVGSLSSIPSIHMAHPIRSPGSSVVSASHASFPSLHLAHHIHSVGSVSTAALADDSFLSGSSAGYAMMRLNNTTLTTTATSCGTANSQDDGEQQVEEEDDDEKKEEENSSCPDFLLRPVLLGDASVNTYEGIGIEVQASPPKEVFSSSPSSSPSRGSGSSGALQLLVRPHESSDTVSFPNTSSSQQPGISNDYEEKGDQALEEDQNNASAVDALEVAAVNLIHAKRHNHQQQPHQPYDIDPNNSKLESLLSFGDCTSSFRCASFDETMSFGRISNIFRHAVRRSLSDADLAGIFLGGSRLLLHETSSVRDVNPLDDSSSWVMDDESDMDYYDTWKVIEDEYDNGYGGGGTLPFLILGTSADDLDSHPHVLSPPLIESLQAFLPIGQSGNNFWMKYSLVRDGANIMTLLQQARGAKYTILALETIDGEVFGAFTTEPWRKNWNTFGGGESFLWKMRHSRKSKCHSIIDQAQKESIVDVYPYTGENNYIQFCTHDRIAVGGGHPVDDGDLLGQQSQEPPAPTTEQESQEPPAPTQKYKKHEWGFGISLSNDLLTGTSSPCVTFGSPSLSTLHKDGSLFEIINLELWTLTPCMTVEEAEKLELSKLFLEAHANRKLYL